jgi:hypothetical protein
MKKLISWTLAGVVGVLLTGCQTPQERVVGQMESMQKQMDKMEKKLDEMEKRMREANK